MAMQGVTFDLMRHNAVGELGEAAWAVILTAVGRSGQEYEVGKSYPDEEFAQVAMSVAQAMNKPLPYVLEGFGAAMVPEMITVYGFLVDRRWSYVDFLLNMHPLLESAFRLHTMLTSSGPTRVTRLRIKPSRLRNRAWRMSRSSRTLRCRCRHHRRVVRASRRLSLRHFSSKGARGFLTGSECSRS